MKFNAENAATIGLASMVTTQHLTGTAVRVDAEAFERNFMGWASGSGLLEEIVEIVLPHIPAAERPKICEQLIKCFEMEDCDTISEVDNQDIQDAYNRLHPEF